MSQHDHGGPVVIGLVNNMPDGALKTTERQFKELLAAAAGNVAVRLRVFSLPELPRSDATRAYINEYYEDFSNLWASRLDGMIVTGTEPRAATLVDEPYWLSLTKLVDWAEEHTVSTIWSCLAAHATVYHLDGISRQKFPEKLSGVFNCAKVADHSIVADTPAKWCIPHSRHNDLPEEALTAAGYKILSRSPVAGADMFVKQRKSLFLFLQGHPEYDPGSLLREYQRDIGRFLRNEREAYPQMPRDYFDADTAAAYMAYRDRAVQHRDVDLLNDFPAVYADEKLLHSWREPAVRIYTNWLAQLVHSRQALRARGT